MQKGSSGQSQQPGKGVLDDVFEAEGAVAGEPLAFAAPAQILPVRPLRVHVTRRYSARAAGLLTSLQNIFHD